MEDCTIILYHDGCERHISLKVDGATTEQVETIVAAATKALIAAAVAEGPKVS